MKKTKLLSTILAMVLVAGMLAACGGTPETPSSTAPAETAPSAEPAEEPADDAAPTDGAFSAALVTDVGGINDQSFNQSAWEGMQRLESDKGVKVSFLESKKDADYAPNLAKVTDDAPDIVWGIGFLMKDALAAAAESNPDQRYALVDDVLMAGQYPERHRRAVPGGAVLLPGRLHRRPQDRDEPCRLPARHGEPRHGPLQIRL